MLHSQLSIGWPKRPLNVWAHKNEQPGVQGCAVRGRGVGLWGGRGAEGGCCVGGRKDRRGAEGAERGSGKGQRAGHGETCRQRHNGNFFGGGGGFVWRGRTVSKFWGGASLERGPSRHMLSLHIPSLPPNTILTGTTGAFSHGARAPTPTAGMAIPAVAVGEMFFEGVKLLVGKDEKQHKKIFFFLRGAPKFSFFGGGGCLGGGQFCVGEIL